jgi:hypothetical protein
MPVDGLMLTSRCGRTLFCPFLPIEIETRDDATSRIGLRKVLAPVTTRERGIAVRWFARILDGKR